MTTGAQTIQSRQSSAGKDQTTTTGWTSGFSSRAEAVGPSASGVPISPLQPMHGTGPLPLGQTVHLFPQHYRPAEMAEPEINTFLAHLLEADYDIRTIQELLGSKDVCTTIYTRIRRST
ncbi:MAG: hypothetical protein ABSE08_02355 [Syntrophobacteraceae bacterium]